MASSRSLRVEDSPGVVLLVCVLSACPAPEQDSDLLSHLPRYEQQRQVLCSRERRNAVTEAFCGAEPPRFSSLVELQNLLGIGFERGRPGFSLIASSSALAMRHTSPINPRAVLVEMPADRADGAFMSLGYVRGDHTVELAVRPPDGDLALYLLRYEQQCHDTDEGCSFADRFTPRTESEWVRWSLYDEVDLKNSVFDCLVCHQLNGPGTPVVFRMQEFRNPWTHWMAPFGDGELALLDDYKLAHRQDEVFAGIPPDEFGGSNPIRVENFLLDSGAVEPVEFLSQVIENEVKASSPDQPRDNSVPGRSPTWDALYERAVRGEVPPVPYHDVKVTDVDKLAAMSSAYREFMSGESDELPDIRNVFLDVALADMSVRPRPGLDGRGILIHMCAQCHNDRLDQTVTRARFNPFHLDELARDVKDRAIDRLQRPAHDRYLMPPALRGELSAEERDACIAVLRQ